MNAEVKTVKAACEKHGEFESRQIFGSIWSKCPACSAEKQKQEDEEREKRERSEALERWNRRLGYAGIPDRFMDRSLKSYKADTEEQKRALAFAEEYADNFSSALATGRSAVFIGKPGTGKTHLAIGIALRIMHRDGRRVLFTTVMRAIRRIRNSWGRNAEESESDAIHALTSPDLLILDEVGVQVGSENEKLLLFDVLNERYENRRPTLLLSNLTLDDREDGGRIVPGIKSYLGERIYDRLREDGGEAIVFDWESYRLNGERT